MLVIGYGAIFAFGYASTEFPPNTAGSELANLPARWDTGWYVGIADGGYRATGPDSRYPNIVFFPAYPLALRAVTTLIHARHRPFVFEWAGVCLSIGFFVCASIYLFRLALEHHHLSPTQGMMAVALLAAYPFAVFYGAVYTESLFLLTVLATFYHAHRNQPLRGSLWGLLAGLTRPTGMLVSVPLAVMLWQRESSKGTRPSITAFAPALAPLIGAALYSAFLYSLVGNPLAWMQAQHQWGRTGYAVWMDIAQLHAITTIPAAELYLRDHLNVVLNGSAIVFVVLLLPLVTVRLGWPATLFVLISILPGLSFGGLMSMGRFTAVIFPVFLALASIRSQTICWICLITFSLGQAFVSSMFFTWRSIY